MALRNTYQRQVQANPTNLNPNQRYVEQYDAMANLANQINQFGQEALNVFAKVDNAAAADEAKRKFNEREVEREDLKRNIELNNNPRVREGLYNKGLEAIDRKYGKEVDTRYQKDYENWVELADKKALLDLRFNATKDLQKQERETLEFNIKSAGKQTVGANEAYIKMIDAGVENDLARAVGNGLISQIERDKMLADYNASKKNAVMENLLITDPEELALNLSKNTYGLDNEQLKSWKKRADDALNLNQLRGAAMLDAEHRANLNSAFDIISRGGIVPQSTMSSLSEKEQRAINIKQMYATQGYDVPTNTRTYGYLQDLYSNHPERFKNVNLYEFAGELSTEDLSAFQQAQDSIIINTKGKAEINPDIKLGNDLMKAAYERMGLKSGQGDYEKKYNFNRLVTEEMKAQMHDKGRTLTSSEQEQIINDMTKKVALRGLFSGSQPTAAVNIDEDTPYIPYDQIPLEEKVAINNMFVRNSVDLTDFDDDDREKFYEDMAGALSLPKSKQAAAIERIVREINKTAQKMSKNGITAEEKAAKREQFTQNLLEVLPDPSMTPYGY